MVCNTTDDDSTPWRQHEEKSKFTRRNAEM
jgi:hypothetical protein